MTDGPEIKKDAMYQLLRDGKVKEFNYHRGKGKVPNLVNCDFRAIDLQGLDADGLDLTGCYFRNSDLRGVDFSNAIMDGASLHDSKVSGAYFPKAFSSDEITMSIIRGTRLRNGL